MCVKELSENRIKGMAINDIRTYENYLEALSFGEILLYLLHQELIHLIDLRDSEIKFWVRTRFGEER